MQFTDDPSLWHERVLLKRVGRTEWLCLNPDNEIERLDLSMTRDSGVRGVRRVQVSDYSISGVDPTQFYTFSDSKGLPEGGKLQKWIDIADDTAAGLGLDYDDKETGSSSSLGMVAKAIAAAGGDLDQDGPEVSGVSGQGLVARALAALGQPVTSGQKWVVAETIDSITAGDDIPNGATVHQHGTKGVAIMTDGTAIFIKLISTASSSSDVKISQLELSRTDVRVLPIRKDYFGKKHLDFRMSTDEALEVTDPDSPVSGPPSALWLCKYILGNGGTPLAFHSKFMNECRLDYGANFTLEHLTLCKLLDIFATYDQFDISRSAGIELVCRKLQIIHEKWRHKLPSFSGPANKQGGIDDDAYLMLGTYETRGNIAVCPALQKWIGEEAAKESLAMKERRKAREERTLAQKASA